MGNPDLRHAGLGFPNGPADNQKIFALPSREILLLSSEHWHHDEAVQAGKRVLFRAMARDGFKPAQISWSPSRYVDEILRDTRDLGLTDFVGWNELDLNYERGDEGNDFADLTYRYGLIGSFQRPVVQKLRSRLPGVDLHYGAWTPDHNALDYVDLWRDAAEACDVIDIHAYSLTQIAAQYDQYRAAFPGKRLALTEWHCKGNLEQERLVLSWLASDLIATDPLFDAAYFFIYRWDNPPEPWDDYDLEHNPDRYALFMDPPRVQTPEPAPMPDYRAMTRAAATTAGIDPDLFVSQINQESGFSLDVIECRRDSGAGARGIAQLMPVHWSEVDPCDPEAALTYAAGLMKSHLAYWNGSWALALSSYNAGRQATIDGLAGRKPGWPFAETVTYVSKILSKSQADTTKILTTPLPDAPVVDTERLYGFQMPREIILQQNPWSCAVRSTYAALWMMAQLDQGEPVTYGDGGPRDVYDWMVPQYDDPSVGLHAADGSELVAMLRSKGYMADRKYPASLADVQVRAGTQPVLLGGRAWGHWVYVWGVRSDGMLLLENPAPGFMGISDELRDSFDRLGPMTMVWIDVPAVTPVPEPVPVPLSPHDDEAGLRNKLGYVTHDVADALDKEVASIEASLGALKAAISTLRAQAPV